MRPRGETRLALSMAAAELGRATWRTLGSRTRTDPDLARRTVENMHSAGELEVVGHVREPGVCRPMNLYAPPGACGRRVAPLVDVVHAWAVAA